MNKKIVNVFSKKSLSEETMSEEAMPEEKTPEETISDAKLAESINNLPDEITPQRDLWQGIELAIQNKPQESGHNGNLFQHNSRRMFVSGTWAASLIAAVLVTWISFGPSTKGNQEIGDPAMLVSLMSDSFTKQKKAMLISYGQSNTASLSPEMQKQLQQLSAARKTIEKALAEDASNADLLNLLNFTQQQELNLLQRLYTTQWQTI